MNDKKINRLLQKYSKNKMAAIFSPNNLSIVMSPRVEPCEWFDTICLRIIDACLDWFEQACQTGPVELCTYHWTFKIAAVNSWKIDVYTKCGVEIWVLELKIEYPQIVIYCSFEISQESYVAFGKKRRKSKIAASRNFEKY